MSNMSEYIQILKETKRPRMVEIKKLGAYSQAKAIGIISEVIGDPAIQRVIDGAGASGAEPSTGNTTAISEAINAILDRHLGKVVAIFEITTDLQREEIEADGDKAISINDLYRVGEAVIKKNLSSSILEKLGNVLGPLSDLQGVHREAQMQAEAASQSTSQTSSQPTSKQANTAPNSQQVSPCQSSMESHEPIRGIPRNWINSI